MEGGGGLFGFKPSTKKLISKLNMSNNLNKTKYNELLITIKSKIKSKIQKYKRDPEIEQIIREQINKLIDGKLDFIYLSAVIQHFFNIDDNYYTNIIFVLYNAYNIDNEYLIELEKMPGGILYKGYSSMNKKNYNIIFNTLFHLIIKNESIDDYKEIFAEEHQMIKTIVQQRICPSFAGIQLSDTIGKIHAKFKKYIEEIKKQMDEIEIKIANDRSQLKVHEADIQKFDEYKIKFSYLEKILPVNLDDKDNILLKQKNVLTIKSNIKEIIGISNEPTNSKKKTK